ncbi:hypothetical protein BDC45DRAFT_140003 [Circinella umbellata]|nr:hypothetical protein BDC45DRAFT_140003 [Circinella umbellata]
MEANNQKQESSSTVEPMMVDVKQEPIDGRVQKAKAHARELSGRHLPKKNIHALQPPTTPTSTTASSTDISPDGPHTPIPTPPPERWHNIKVKEEKDDSNISSLYSNVDNNNNAMDIKKSLTTPSSTTAPPSLLDAMRYLPLYTVQLFEESSKKYSFFVVDTQVSMLLGLSTEAFWKQYPNLLRRLVTTKEKDRLWSPLSSMICNNNMDMKEKEKRRFSDSSMYFVLLEQVVSLIKKDYSYLSQSLITITLDIGYKDENTKTATAPPPLPLPPSPSALHYGSSNNNDLNNNNENDGNHTASARLPPKRPGAHLPPKFWMKMQKCGKLKK